MHNPTQRFVGCLLLVAILAGSGWTQQTDSPAVEPAPGEWGTRSKLPQPNSETAVAELNGKIYVIGGYPSNRQTVRTVQVYDAASDTWRLARSLPIPLNHAMAAAVDGKLYVIGGQTEASSNSPFVDSVFQYDPATDRWTPRASMPTARSAGAAAVINGKIYVAGGRPPRGSDFAVYDPVADSWAALPDLPTQRNHLAAAAIGGRVYVAGGRFGGNYQSEVTDIVEVFDPATSAWSKGPLMLVKRSGHNSVLANGCWHIWGGEGNPDNETGLFPQHDVLNLATGQWTSLPPMAVTVHGVTGAAFLNGLIYVPGGGTAQGGSSGSTIHQVYRPAMTCP